MVKQRQAALPAGRKEAHLSLYTNRMLGEYETVSGFGSTLLYTRNIRKSLQRLSNAGIFNSLLDVGCGDVNWLSALDLEDIPYMGIDIVEPLIEDNKRRLDKKSFRFEVLDIVESVPPKRDFVLCRDVFTHLPAADIAQALNNIKQSGAQYVACTSYYPALVADKMRDRVRDHLNNDAPAGQWRPVNLSFASFFLPPPLLSIPENEQGKTLDVWSLKQVPALDVKNLRNSPADNPVSAEDFNRYVFFRKLCALPFVQKVTIFGSRMRGTHRPDSDIDLMLYCTHEPAREEWLSVCDIVEHADTRLTVDCMYFSDAIPIRPLEFKTLYERASA